MTSPILKRRRLGDVAEEKSNSSTADLTIKALSIVLQKWVIPELQWTMTKSEAHQMELRKDLAQNITRYEKKEDDSNSQQASSDYSKEKNDSRQNLINKILIQYNQDIYRIDKTFMKRLVTDLDEMSEQDLPQVLCKSVEVSMADPQFQKLLTLYI